MSKKKFKKPKQQEQKQAPSPKTVSPAGSPAPPWQYACIFAFAFLLYSNTLNHDFAFDDSVVITGNEFTKKGTRGIHDLVTKDLFAGIYGESLALTGGRYRPLSLVTHAIEYQLWEDKHPGRNHFVNVVLYSIACIILFILLQKIFQNNIMAFAAALIFVAHPVHSEAVANIKSRDEIFSMLFLCLALIFLLRSTSEKKIALFAASIFTYALALLSKENGLTFLLIIPLTLFFFGKETIQRAFVKTLPFVAVAVIYFLVRASLLHTDRITDSSDIMENPFYGVGFSDKLATIARIMGKYLLLLFVPHPLSSDYSLNAIPIAGWGNLFSILSLAAYGALTWLAIKKFRGKSLLSYGILFYLFTIAIVSNVAVNIGAPMGERFMFLPSIGFAVAVAPALFRLLKINSSEWSAKLYVPLGIILVLFSYKTFDRNAAWKNNLTLFSTDVNTVPNSAKIHYYYGNTLLVPYLGKPDTKGKQDTLRLSLNESKKAAAIDPKFHLAYYNIGLAYQELKNADSAIYFLNKVLELQPAHILTQGALGAVYGQLKGDYDKAMGYLLKAVQYNPKDDGALMNLGNCYGYKGDYAKAIETFERVKQLNPKKEDQCNLSIGITYGIQRNYNEAVKYFEMVLQNDPNNVVALVNMQNTYNSIGNPAKANEYAQRLAALQQKK